MKIFRGFVIAVVFSAFLGLGCGGGGATFEECSSAYQTYLKKQNSQMPDDAAKMAAEQACTACKSDKKACKMIVDNLKNQ